MSGTSPRSARGNVHSGVQARRAGTDGKLGQQASASPRAERPRQKTAEELVEQLGLSAVGVRRDQWDRPWDRLTQVERAAWLAEYTPRPEQAQPTWSLAVGSPTERRATLASPTVSTSADTARTHNFFAEGVPPLSRMVTFLSVCELTHLAPSLIELKYITPQDLVDADDDELLDVLSRLRYRMAPPERRRFVRAVVAAKREAGVHTALTLESVQALGYGSSVIADLKTERRTTDLTPDRVYEGAADSKQTNGEPEPEPEPEPEDSHIAADGSAKPSADTPVPAYRSGDLELVLDKARNAHAIFHHTTIVAPAPAPAPAVEVANVSVRAETCVAVPAAVATGSSEPHNQNQAGFEED